MVKYNMQSSKIEFTLGGFITTISSILVIVLGFYSYVIEPRFDNIKTNMDKLESKTININKKIEEININLARIEGILKKDEKN